MLTEDLHLHLNCTCLIVDKLESLFEIEGITIQLIQKNNNNRDIGEEKKKPKITMAELLLPISINLNKDSQLPIHPINSISRKHCNGPILLVLHR